MNTPEFEVDRFEPTDPIGWEHPVESEPFLIRETQQYLINVDALSMRWDVAYLKNGKRYQCFVLYKPHFTDDPTAEERIEWRAIARKLLRDEVPSDAQQFRLKLPRGTWSAAYV